MDGSPFMTAEQTQPHMYSPLLRDRVINTPVEKHLTHAYSIMLMHTYTNDPGSLLASLIRGHVYEGLSGGREGSDGWFAVHR